MSEQINYTYLPTLYFLLMLKRNKTILKINYGLILECFQKLEHLLGVFALQRFI